MKDKLMKIMENFSKAMVQPVMYLSITGLIIIIGVLLTNETLTGALPFLQWAPLQMIGGLIYSTMMAIIQNLGVIFAVGIAAALAKREKHHAGLIAVMCYMLYLSSMNTFLNMMGNIVPADQLQGSGQAMVFGWQVLDTGVFSGMILGCIVGYIFNKTSDKEFSGVKQLYSGTRFSFLILIPVTIAFGVMMTLLWPSVQAVISKATGFIASSGSIGVFLYGFLERILVPTGLHHLVYTPFFFTDLGGVVEAGGQMYAGSVPILMMEMNNPEVTKFSSSIIYNAQTLSKMFGLVGASLAMYHTAKPENKGKVKAILLPATLAGCLAGITEPLEFAFLFCAPMLFLTHAILAGLGMAVLSVLNVTALAGGGIINVVIMNILMGVEKTSWPLFILVGLVQAVVYYFVFKFLIIKFNMKTPGREAATEEKKDVKLLDVSERIGTLVDGLGGITNIDTVENCFTRLRVEVKDISLVSDDIINKVPNSGIVKKGKNIQVIFGLQVSTVRKAVDKYLAAQA